MDNIGDWLYILFLIIAGISGLFSSKNKKKRPKQILGQPDQEIPTDEENNPQKGFWEILQEMQEEPQKEMPDIPQAKEPPHKQEKRKVSPTPQSFIPEEKHNARQTKVKQPSVVPTAEEESLLPDLELNHAAELRKAVIYTEILNRKY